MLLIQLIFFFTDLYKNDILKWEADDKVFVKTHSFSAMLQKVRNQHFVTFVGSPGSGKSATAHHIALILQKEGYSILPVKDIKELETYCNPKCQQVFVLDDVLGIVGLDENKLMKLNDYQDRLTEPVMKQTKIIMTCRKVVHRDKRLDDSFLISNENVVLLQSDEHVLNNQDKRELLEKYDINATVLSECDLKSTSYMFPYLCKLFSTKKEFQQHGAVFFRTPVKCILDELKKMKTNEIHYAALFLLVAYQNQLSENDLENDDKVTQSSLNEKTRTILKAISVSSSTEPYEFTNALSRMEETYTLKCGSKYTFVHDSMFEITALHFGLRFPELMIDIMSSDYIANNIKLNKKQLGTEKTENASTDSGKSDKDNKSNADSGYDISIELVESQYPYLAKRLYRDIENGELYNVFGNKALRNPTLLEDFKKEMDTKSYLEIFKVFLYEIKETINVRNDKNPNEKAQSEKNLTNTDPTQPFNRRQYSREKHHDILLNKKGDRICVRAVSWVIYYGHHHILQYIIDRIMEQKKEVDDLFRNQRNKSHRHFSENRHVSNDIKVNEEEEEVIEEELRLLCLGCLSGDVATVQILLKHVDKNLLSSHNLSFWGIYPFGISGHFGYVDITRELIKNGFDVNQKSAFYRPLVDACYGGNVSLVSELLKAGAVINEVYKENVTSLIAACKVGHTDVVTELIKEGADLNLACYYAYWTRPEGMDYEEWEQISSELGENVIGYHRVERETPMTAACSGGQLSIVEMLINKGVNVDDDKQSVGTPLTVACENGHLNVVNVLLQAGAKINLENTYGKSPITCARNNGQWEIVETLIKEDVTKLSYACFLGDLSSVENFIKADVDVNLKDGVIAPITAACFAGHSDIVKVLIRAGANVNLRDGDHLPLTTACYRGNLKVIEELLKADIDVNLMDEYHTPLEIACFRNYVSVTRQLIQKGVNVNKEIQDTETPLAMVCFSGYLELAKVLINAKAHIDSKGICDSPLGNACRRGHVDLVELLTKSGANVNLRSPIIHACLNASLTIVTHLLNNGANTDLHRALVNACCGKQRSDIKRKEQLDIVKELIKVKADVSFESEFGTALKIASESGHLSVVQQLIKARASINLGQKKTPPLTYACLNGHLSVVKELIKKKADVNLNGENKTPLTAACFKGHLDVVKELIKAKADINLGDGTRTPLIAAYDEGFLKIFKYLIFKAEANVNYIYNQSTPLMAACRGRDILAVQELIKAKADVNLGVDKSSPLSIAYSWGDTDLIDELIEAGAKYQLKT